MFLSYFTLLVALSLSAVAAWYSIVGLTAIFAAAVIPIVIMGGILEVAKLTATVWLHEHWARCRWLMKSYLVSAVIILMVITSMGIFGFLSRAHIEQSAPIGDTAAQIEIIEEKIEIEQQVIAQYRQDLEILNQQIERFSELGAVTRGVNARATQQAERETIFDQIAQSQSMITELRQQRAPLAADIRKIETEVGPIKYIAALIYGDNPDQNLLEKAVRWVIILLVVVFDPLAIMLLLAATESLRWRKESAPAYEPDDGPLTDSQLEEIQAAVDEWKRDNQSIDEMEPAAPKTVVSEQQVPVSQSHPYLHKDFSHFENLQPMVVPVETAPDEDDDDAEELPGVKAAIKKWKSLNPNDTIKNQRHLLQRGDTTELPWMALVEELPDIEPQHSFGAQLPSTGHKRDTHVRTDLVPNRVFKHNGTDWIEVDKHQNDSYTYNTAYVDHLIEKIALGQYDPDLLSESESEQVALRLQQKAQE